MVLVSETFLRVEEVAQQLWVDSLSIVVAPQAISAAPSAPSSNNAPLPGSFGLPPVALNRRALRDAGPEATAVLVVQRREARVWITSCTFDGVGPSSRLLSLNSDASVLIEGALPRQ